MRDKRDWVYAQVVDKGHFLFPRRPFWIGWVEFAPFEFLDPESRSALDASLQEHELPPSTVGEQRRMIARTIVVNEDSFEARAEGEFRLREAAGILATKVVPFPMEFHLLPAGFLLDLLRGTPQPLFAPRKGFPTAAVAMMDSRAQQPLHVLNMVLTASALFGELGAGFLRSFQWRQLAQQARTRGEKLLLYWMSAEALCTVEAYGSPIANLMAAAGFPIGKGAESARKLVKEIPDYRYWRTRLVRLIDGIRDARNKIVHHGYRDSDLRSALSETDEQDGVRFLEVATQCVHDYVLLRLPGGAASIADTWSRRPPELDQMRTHAEWVTRRMAGRDRFADRL